MVKKFFKNQELIFTLSTLIVSVVNYLFNLVLGRILGPKEFANVALLITMLLVLSFFATTFQMLTTKFIATFTEKQMPQFQNLLIKYVLIIGIIIGLGFVVFASKAQELLHTDNPIIFILFGVGIPIYLTLSVNRGLYQGRQEFIKLAITYQLEAWTKFIVALILIYSVTNILNSILIQIAILFSLILGLFPFKLRYSFKNESNLSEEVIARIRIFFIMTLLYEFTQIIINNVDIVMVKMYFTDVESGLYAAMALIGRIIYFTTWILVMMLMPKVIEKEKLGQKSQGLFIKYFLMIAVFGVGAILSCLLFSKVIISLLFGASYLPISALLWKYALTTTLFAMSNLIIYYFISLDKYGPTWFALLCGFSIVCFIWYSHDTLNKVVEIQILINSILLLFLGIYTLLYFNKRNKLKLG